MSDEDRIKAGRFSMPFVKPTERCGHRQTIVMVHCHCMKRKGHTGEHRMLVDLDAGAMSATWKKE